MRLYASVLFVILFIGFLLVRGSSSAEISVYGLVGVGLLLLVIFATNGLRGNCPSTKAFPCKPEENHGALK
jgi:hypothetical protein